MRALLWLCAGIAALGLLTDTASSTAWLGLGAVVAAMAWATRRHSGIVARRAGVPIGLGGGGLHLGAGAGRAGAKVLTKRATWLVLGVVALLVVGYSIHSTIDRAALGLLVAAVAVLWRSRHLQPNETPAGMPADRLELLALPARAVARAVARCRYVVVTALAEALSGNRNLDTPATIGERASLRVVSGIGGDRRLDETAGQEPGDVSPPSPATGTDMGTIVDNGPLMCPVYGTTCGYAYRWRHCRCEPCRAWKRASR